MRFRPGSLTDIPAQAFYGCTSLSTVIFDNDLTSIDKFAFADCSALKKIEIPDTVKYIADTAFDGCNDLVIYCTQDSYALHYAIANDIDYFITDADPGFILGDADGSEEITVMDATFIERFLIELSLNNITFDEEAADVDGDSRITAADATYIQRYVLGMEVPYRIGERIFSM